MALDFSEQLKLLSEASGRGVKPRRASQDEINTLIEGARLIASTKQPDQAVDEVITALAREIVEEDDRRLRKDPQLARQRQAQFEKLLAAEQLGMDESDMKGSGQIIREDNENMGYSDYAEYEASQREGKAALMLDENLIGARESVARLEAQAKNQPNNKNYTSQFFQHFNCALE